MSLLLDSAKLCEHLALMLAPQVDRITDPLRPERLGVLNGTCLLRDGFTLDEAALPVELDDEGDLPVVVSLGDTLLEDHSVETSLGSYLHDERRIDVPLV